MHDENLATITDVAKRFGVTLRALRFYEEKGLVQPRRVGTARFFSADDEKRIARILQLSRFGFSLRDISGFFERDPDAAVDRLGMFEQLQQLSRRRDEIETIMIEMTEAMEGNSCG